MLDTLHSIAGSIPRGHRGTPRITNLRPATTQHQYALRPFREQGLLAGMSAWHELGYSGIFCRPLLIRTSTKENLNTSCCRLRFYQDLPKHELLCLYQNLGIWCSWTSGLPTALQSLLRASSFYRSHGQLNCRTLPSAKQVNTAGLQWNIERGYKLEEIVKELKNIDADLIALQEVDIGCERSSNIDTGIWPVS